MIALVQSISGHGLKIALWNVNQPLFVCKYICIAGPISTALLNQNGIGPNCVIGYIWNVAAALYSAGHTGAVHVKIIC